MQKIAKKKARVMRALNFREGVHLHAIQKGYTLPLFFGSEKITSFQIFCKSGVFKTPGIATWVLIFRVETPPNLTS